MHARPGHGCVAPCTRNHSRTHGTYTVIAGLHLRCESWYTYKLKICTDCRTQIRAYVCVRMFFFHVCDNGLWSYGYGYVSVDVLLVLMHCFIDVHVQVYQNAVCMHVCMYVRVRKE
jgi:hypothetical protein